MVFCLIFHIGILIYKFSVTLPSNSPVLTLTTCLPKKLWFIDETYRRPATPVEVAHDHLSRIEV